MTNCTQLSPDIFDPRKMDSNFLKANFECFRLSTGRDDENEQNCPSYSRFCYSRNFQKFQFLGSRDTNLGFRVFCEFSSLYFYTLRQKHCFLITLFTLSLIADFLSKNQTNMHSFASFTCPLLFGSWQFKCLIAKEIDLEGCNNHNLVIETLFAEVETHGVVIDTRSLW